MNLKDLDFYEPLPSELLIRYFLPITALVVYIFLWSLTNLILSCQKRPFYSLEEKKLRILMFLLFAFYFFTLLLFVYAVIPVDSGISSIFFQVDDVKSKLGSLQVIAESVVTNLDAGYETAYNAVQICAGNPIPEIPDPLPAIKTAIDLIKDRSDQINPLVLEINSFSISVEESLFLALNICFLIIPSLIFFILLVYFTTSALIDYEGKNQDNLPFKLMIRLPCYYFLGCFKKYKNIREEDTRLKTLKDFYQRFDNCYRVVGIFFLCLFVIQVGLQSAIYLVNEDVCVDVDSFIRNFAINITGYTCDENPINLLCFAQDCQQNPYQDYVGTFKDNLNFLHVEIEIRVDAAKTSPISGDRQLCVEKFESAQDLFLKAQSGEIEHFLSCSFLNSKYRQIFHMDLCNKIKNHLQILFITGIVAIWSTTFALSAEFLLDWRRIPQKKSDYKLVKPY